MQKVKEKLEQFLDNEMKCFINKKEGYEVQYKKECKKAVNTVVNKVYEVLIYERSISYYKSQPHEFSIKELPKYRVVPFDELVNELFTNYTIEVLGIFETDLLDSIRDIKNDTNNKFVDEILGYIHRQIIDYYKLKKEEIEDILFFDTVRDYNYIIVNYISMIKKEIYSNQENSFCYNTFLKHLEEVVEELITKLRIFINDGSGELHEKRIRYIYYYIKANILTNFKN